MSVTVIFNLCNSLLTTPIQKYYPISTFSQKLKQSGLPILPTLYQIADSYLNPVTMPRGAVFVPWKIDSELVLLPCACVILTMYVKEE